MTQEIIVYRSPMEQFYWNNPQYILYLIAGAILIIIAVKLIEWIKK